MKQHFPGQDPFLKDLLATTPLERPSDDFVARVMAEVESIPVPVPVRKIFLIWIRRSFPWILLSGLILVVFFTSDFLVINKIPGIADIRQLVVTSATSFLQSFQNIFSGKFAFLVLAILVSGAILFIIERLFLRKTTSHKPYIL
jgi:hypothetical protein